MAGALSQDLRNGVIDAALSGLSARGAVARFEVGVATAIAWVARAPQGPRQALPRDGRRGSKLEAHRDFLLELVAAKDDIAHAEMHP